MVCWWFLGGFLDGFLVLGGVGGVSVVSWWFLGWSLGGDCPCLGGFLVVSLWSLGGDSSVSRWFLGGFLVVSWMVSWWFLDCFPIAKGLGC